MGRVLSDTDPTSLSYLSLESRLSSLSPFTLHCILFSLLSTPISLKQLLSRAPARSMLLNHIHSPHLSRLSGNILNPNDKFLLEMHFLLFPVTSHPFFLPPSHSSSVSSAGSSCHPWILILGPFLWLLHFLWGNHFQSHNLQYNLYINDSEIFLTLSFK